MAQDTVKMVRFHQVGGPEVLSIDELPLPKPGPGEVRLRVHAIGLNRAELLFRQGVYLVRPELPSKNGYEASGVVEAVGPDVEQTLIGNSYSVVPSFVLGQYGVYGEVAILPVHALVAYPNNLSYPEAASVWMAYMTAYGALVYYSVIKPGDVVIITAASSSVGIAAIQMARAQGAITIATTRNRDKKDKLQALGAHHVIVINEDDLVAETSKITGDMGAKIVFDAVGGHGVEDLLRATAHGGTVFIHGILSLEPTLFPFIQAVSKGISMRGYTFFEFIYNPTIRAEAEQYIYTRLQDGRFKPIIDRIFHLEQIAEAHRYMESNAQIGKIVVTVP